MYLPKFCASIVRTSRWHAEGCRLSTPSEGFRCFSIVFTRLRVQVLQRHAADRFVILGSDGLWERVYPRVAILIWKSDFVIDALRFGCFKLFCAVSYFVGSASEPFRWIGLASLVLHQSSHVVQTVMCQHLKLGLTEF